MILTTRKRYSLFKVCLKWKCDGKWIQYNCSLDTSYPSHITSQWHHPLVKSDPYHAVPPPPPRLATLNGCFNTFNFQKWLTGNFLLQLHYIIFQTGYENREACQQRSEWQKSSVTSQWPNLPYGQNNMTLIMKTIWKKKKYLNSYLINHFHEQPF